MPRPSINLEAAAGPDGAPVGGACRPAGFPCGNAVTPHSRRTLAAVTETMTVS